MCANRFKVSFKIKLIPHAMQFYYKFQFLKIFLKDTAITIY